MYFCKPYTIMLATLVLTHAVGAADYYVDSKAGSDANSGHSLEAAWESLEKVNATRFQPGDRILLAAGSVFEGTLKPQGEGTPDNPIVVTTVGEGPKAVINAQGKHEATIHLYNTQGWEISKLEITNTSAEPIEGLKGVFVQLEDYGTARHFVLRDLYIHDVTGVPRKYHGRSGGILTQNKGEEVPSRFDGLLIENNHIVRCDRDGITGNGNASREVWFPNLNVVIRGNLLEDIGGDGIIVHSCDGALVEYNRVYGLRLRDASDPAAAAGIWPWSSDNTVIQFNEVSGMKGIRDGQGFDSDYNCRNTLFQFNYSHNNEGGFMLICDNGLGYDAWLKSIGNDGTVIRYNVSINDGERTFHFAGNATNTEIYNNIIINTTAREIPLVLAADWHGKPGKTYFANNIFYFPNGKARYSYGERRHHWKETDGSYVLVPGFEALDFTFEHNLYYGTHLEKPDDPGTVIADPQFTAAVSELFDKNGQPKRGLDVLTLLKLQQDSPARDMAIPIEDNGGRDFAGKPVAEDGPHNIGIFE